MIKMGHYRIAWGGIFFAQAGKAYSRRWPWFWILREASPIDIDKKQRYDLDTKMEYKGRTYRYWKWGKKG